MIRMNVSQSDIENGNLEKVVQKIFWYQIFYKDSVGKDLRKLKLLKDMYEAKNGDAIKINRRTKLIDAYYNILKPLCDTATRTFIGRVPDIVSNSNDKEKERIQTFTLMLKHYDFDEEISDVALQSSICGSGFGGLYADIGDTFPKIRSLNPLYTNVVYDCSIAMRRLFAYHIYFEANSNGGRYVCIIYTKKKMFAYYTSQTTIPLQQAFGVYPYNTLFAVSNGQFSYSAEHGFNDIPIYEFMNNKLCSGDCTPALSVIALYSELQNNRFQNVDDIINYLLVIKNARLGDEKETSAAINLIQNQRVLPIEGDNVDAKFLSNPLNQTDISKLATEYKDTIHLITGIPDFTSVEFTQNASDVIIKAKTKPLLDLCQEKEKWFNRAYFPMLMTILDFIKTNDSKLYSKVKFDVESCDLVYTHALPSNETDAVNRIVNLSNIGMLDPRVALQWLPSIPNVDEYIKGVKDYNEYVDIRKKNVKNENIDGVNNDNIEKQNAEPVSKDQQDNIVNFIKGKAQDLSDNKV